MHILLIHLKQKNFVVDVITQFHAKLGCEVLRRTEDQTISTKNSIFYYMILAVLEILQLRILNNNYAAIKAILMLV